MASAIGIRVYRISVHKKRTGLSANVEPLSKTAGAFISGYVKAHSTATQNEEMERSWYFDIKHEDGHPTFNSLAKEAGAILEDMYEALKGDRS